MRPIDFSSLSQRDRKLSLRWPLIVVALLSGHLLLMVGAAVIATRDRSFAVAPNYYERALAWDKTRAEGRASEKLGWTVGIEPSRDVTPDGQRKLSVVLKDSQGQPISNASVQLEFYHHAHARDSQVVTIPSSSEPGRYTSVLPMRYAGFWQFDLRASAGDQLWQPAENCPE